MRDLLPQNIDVPLMTVVTTPIFLLLFFGLVVWIYSKRRKSVYQRVAGLPFDDEQQEGER
ncbi:MAG: cbb3-type cytochrome c oxidase subunit 3 [Bdellovibrionales bacterium]|nr:cbb3-type cytochrome c oxidase subunit 3 [Bdellovibrionales bacterium]